MRHLKTLVSLHNVLLDDCAASRLIYTRVEMNHKRMQNGCTDGDNLGKLYRGIPSAMLDA